MKGYWTKGFASTFDPVGAINLGLQWKERKKAQKKIDDAVEQLKLNSTALAAKFDSDRADGSITQQEYSDAVVWALPLGDEIMGRVEKLYSGFRQLTQEQIDNELGEIDAFYNLSENLNFSNLEEMKSFRSNLTQEKAKTKWDLIIKSIESRKAQPTTEVFTTAEAVKAKYPNAGYEYSATAKGYVPTFQKPEAPKTGLDIMGETGKKLDYAYDTGNASHFNQMAKSLGVATTFETYKKGHKEEPIPTPKTIPVPTSIENIREDISNADTLETARRIYNNGVQQYGEEAFTKAVGITDIDKFWADGQIPYLNNIKTAIGNILDEKGWLKKGTLTSAEVGLDFKGEQSVEEIYEMLRKEYKKYRDMLEKMGIDISQFPKLKPLEEIEKVGLGEGFWGFGKQRGQYKSIY